MEFLDFIFPKTCLSCGKHGNYICLECLAKVRLSKPICPYCEKASIDGITHIKCQKKYGLNGLISVWEYEGVIRKAVLALKYRYATAIGDELVNYLTDKLKELILPNTSHLMPVPIYWYRQNVRGFNQSNLVGGAVAKTLNLKFVPDLLVRRKQTIPQVELSGVARRQNLKGVFVTNPGIEIPDSVLLFDDVFTTGSTLFEATKTLKHARVQKVWGLTIAR